MPVSPALAPLHMAIAAQDELVLRGALVYPHRRTGTRYPLAVLVHQYPSTRDCYAPLTADLHAAGVATLAFDLRGHGESVWTPSGVKVADFPAGPTMGAFGEAFMGSASKVGFPMIADDIVRVTSWGIFQNFIDASRVLLVGGSVGGTGVLLAAPRVGPGLRGVLTFAAAGAGVHGPDADGRIRRNCQGAGVPMLLTTSEQDPFDGAANAKRWSAGVSGITVRVVPGSDHAMAIYYAVRKEALDFARRVFVTSATSGAKKKTTKR
jgi:pimeloyl-ACP methyl ester carboxylesterase